MSAVAGRGPEQGGWLAENRARWDELARIHTSTALYDLDGVVAGRDDLRPWEDAELGPIDGLDLIHLQCHIGTDTVALARRGARTVGLDFSGDALETARDLAQRCGLRVELIQSDVLDAATSVGRTFDVVYTGIGALGWLPDLRPWARVVHDLLRPGGFLYVTELHPMWVAVIEDGRSICQHAIDAPFERWDDDGSYADPTARLEHTASWERLHAIGDVLTAVLDADLAVELFHEFDVTPAPTPWLVRRDDGLYGFGPEQRRFPLTYSLRARRRA